MTNNHLGFQVKLNTIASVCHSTADNPEPHRFVNFLAYAIPSICLVFLWTAFTWDILSNCSCCIWGGSASSRTQTGCEVLCLLGFLCDWPQCLVFRHRLSSHSERGGGEKQGGRACMCATCAVFWWGNWLGSELTATRTWGCTVAPQTGIISRALRAESWEEEASRQFSFLLMPLIQSYTDSNTQPLYVGCHIHRGCDGITGADGSNELTELSLVQVVFYATSVSDSPL